MISRGGRWGGVRDDGDGYEKENHRPCHHSPLYYLPLILVAFAHIHVSSFHPIVSFSPPSPSHPRPTAPHNDQWMSRHGPIVYDHLWHGEIYDSRQEAALWPTASPIALFPAGTWGEAAVEMIPNVGEAYPQMMPAIRVIENYTAVKVVSPEPGRKDALLFDFGQNMAGFTTLTLDTKALSELWTKQQQQQQQQRRRQRRRSTPPTMTVIARLKHTEIVAAGGDAANNFYPGMEFNHASATCSMPDWYASDSDKELGFCGAD